MYDKVRQSNRNDSAKPQKNYTLQYGILVRGGLNYTATTAWVKHFLSNERKDLLPEGNENNLSVDELAQKIFLKHKSNIAIEFSFHKKIEVEEFDKLMRSVPYCCQSGYVFYPINTNDPKSLEDFSALLHQQQHQAP